MTAVNGAVVADLASFTGVNADVVRAAVGNVGSGDSAFLVVSGKMGSGKDTIAPLALTVAGFPDAVHHYYADSLKDEVDQMLTHARYLDCEKDVVAYLQAAWNVPAAQASVLGGHLWSAAADVHTHARTRSTLVRNILQFYGTDVRRADDPQYWVKLGLGKMLTDLASGHSVYVTDARFPNEVSWPRTASAHVVRLRVTGQTQIERLTDRDGVAPDRSMLEHVSETALDDYTFFDAVIDCDDTTIDEASAAVAASLPLTTVTL